LRVRPVGPILVFGTPGCSKKEFLRQLELSGVWRGVELERVWEKSSGGRKFSVLLDDALSERRTALQAAIGALKGDPHDSGKALAIGVHATHFVEAMLSCPLPVADLEALGATLCVTIHDDLYAVKKRLAEQGFSMPYQQLLLWRSAELLVADLVASRLVPKRSGQLDPPNIWLGAKHTRISVHRLLNDPTAPKIYAAFSITGVLRVHDRDRREELIQETNEYRTKLHDLGLVVFDPATLDDRLLINKVLLDTAPRDETIVVETHERWPYRIGADEAYQPCVEDPGGVFPLAISHAEAFLLKGGLGSPHSPYSDIDAHITQIDLRYVAQADLVTVWRPFLLGHQSLGCYREASTAADLGKEVIGYCPAEDEEAFRKNPANQQRPLREFWPPNIPLIPDRQVFWTMVVDAVERLRRGRAGCESPLQVAGAS